MRQRPQRRMEEAGSGTKAFIALYNEHGVKRLKASRAGLKPKSADGSVRREMRARLTDDQIEGSSRCVLAKIQLSVFFQRRPLLKRCHGLVVHSHESRSHNDVPTCPHAACACQPPFSATCIRP